MLRLATRLGKRGVLYSDRQCDDMRITKILWIAVPLAFAFAVALTLLGPGPGRKPEVWLRQIVVQANKADPDHVERARRKIESIYERLEAGENFRRLAFDESEALNAAEEGDMGWIGEGILPKDLEAAAFALGPGRFSKVIEKDLGPDVLSYRIFYVEKRRNF